MAKKATEPEPAIRKSFLVVGGVAIGAAVLGFVLMNFLAGGGGGEEPPPEDDAAALTTSTGPTSTGVATATPAPTTVTQNVLTPGGRDPFVVGAGEADPAPPPPPPPAPAATPAPVVQQQAQPTYQPQQQNVSDATSTSVAVLHVYGDAADVRVDDTVHEGARTGQTLSGRFTITDIAGSCVYMNDGDVPFKVCTGESVQR